jgi:hypothetical protein
MTLAPITRKMGRLPERIAVDSGTDGPHGCRPADVLADLTVTLRRRMVSAAARQTVCWNRSARQVKGQINRSGGAGRRSARSFATAAKTVFGVDQVGLRRPTLMAKRLLPVKTHRQPVPCGWRYYQEVPMDWCTRLNDGRVELMGWRIDGFVRGIHADRIDGFSVV